MSRNILKFRFENLRCFLRDTSSNIIASVVASIIITSLIGKTAIEDTKEMDIFLVLIIVVVFLVIFTFIYFSLKLAGRKKYKPIKAIVFDFDGTLSKCKIPDIHSPWELIWRKTGYSINDCHELYKKFKYEEITHQEWCDETCNKFMNGNFDKMGLLEVSQSFQLIDDVKIVLEKLNQKGIKLYLVSGSIKQLINHIWGNDLDDYFNRTAANIFRFKDEKLVEIVGTKYDFEGKAKFIKEVFKTEDFKNPKEILFIGNSDNDQSAYKSGAQTLCLNPLEADHNNKKIWHDSIKIDNYTQLLSFIEKEYL